MQYEKNMTACRAIYGLGMNKDEYSKLFTDKFRGDVEIMDDGD